jgi:hypothetical protein
MTCGMAAAQLVSVTINSIKFSGSNPEANFNERQGSARGALDISKQRISRNA